LIISGFELSNLPWEKAVKNLPSNEHVWKALQESDKLSALQKLVDPETVTFTKCKPSLEEIVSNFFEISNSRINTVMICIWF
jgi:hypothetical protein